MHKTHSLSRRLGFFLLAVLLLPLTATATPYPELKLYLDADQTGTRNAGQSILRGIELALADVDHRINGIPVTIAVRNHRGSSPRSKRHLQQFATDAQALALFAGLHSPPLLAHRDYINDQQLLTLVPWAAAGPITRGPNHSNWIFRLSVDDSKAGDLITRYAVDKQGFQKPWLVLEETGWGRSNQNTMTRALADRGLKPAGVSWFNWGLGRVEARSILRDAANAGADVIFLVANAPEGITLAKAMLSLPSSQQRPIRSHWGITGGNFASEMHGYLNKLDLSFIQTRFSFNAPELTPFQQAVLTQAINHFDDITSARDIKAPTGLIHAYDLTRLLLDAARTVQFSGDIQQDRQRVKAALETVDRTVQGLIKPYQRPFSPYHLEAPDAHEALDINDFTMGYYDAAGTIHLISR